MFRALLKIQSSKQNEAREKMVTQHMHDM